MNIKCNVKYYLCCTCGQIKEYKDSLNKIQSILEFVMGCLETKKKTEKMKKETSRYY